IIRVHVVRHVPHRLPFGEGGFVGIGPVYLVLSHPRQPLLGRHGDPLGRGAHGCTPVALAMAARARLNPSGLYSSTSTPRISRTSDISSSSASSNSGAAAIRRALASSS